MPNDPTLDMSGGPPPVSPRDKVGLPPRYADRGLVDSGGMGDVRRAFDTVLEREVAIKLPHAVDDQAEGRFRREAIYTARIRHSGVVRVLDVGRTTDGRLWYSMDLLDGAVGLDTLGARVREQRDRAWGAPDEAPSILTLATAIRDAARVVTQAHAQGIIHRDLKPPNLLHDIAGRTWVVDWGIASMLGSDAPLDIGSGTFGFAAPEQWEARHGAQGPWTDVWGLGATFFHMLTGTSPPRSAPSQVVRDLLVGLSVPDVLVGIVAHCLEPVIDVRLQTASELAERLTDWIDGIARRKRAEAIARGAAESFSRAESARGRAAEAEARSAMLLAAVPSWATEEEKTPAWAEAEVAERARADATWAEEEGAETLRRALQEDPGYDEARSWLGDHLERAADRAEQLRDARTAQRVASVLRALDPDRWAAWSERGATLTLRTDVPAAVRCSRYVPRFGRLEEVVVGELGSTPLVDVAVCHGSLVLTLSAPGRATIRVPVVAPRGGRVMPGLGDDGTVHLPAPGPPGCVWIAEGPVWTGGDPAAADAAPRRWHRVPGFWLMVHPVTVAEYLAYLTALDAAGAVGEANRRAPEAFAGNANVMVTVTRMPGGAWGLRSPLDAAQAGALPVVGVSQRDALAYAVWRSAVDGWSWSLPHEVEWEKAARGADERAFPWGDGMDPSWANVATSRAGPPRPIPVTEAGMDVSPYGVCGLAGNVREWCINAYERAGSELGREPAPNGDLLYTARGGCSVSAPDSARAACRTATAPDARRISVGFRLRAAPR